MPQLEFVNDYMRTYDFQRNVQDSFFDAMMAGYAGAAQEKEKPDLPGLKVIEWTNEYCGSWRVLDSYLVSSLGQYSGGTTTIWYNDTPIWMMQYMGYYREEAIPCLKAALRANYERKEFNGGRGPQVFRQDGLIYLNTTTSNNFYGDAHGEEKIVSEDGRTTLGEHRYHSTYLIDKLRTPRKLRRF